MRGVGEQELRRRLGPYFDSSVDPLYVWQRNGEGELVFLGANAAAEAVPCGRARTLVGRRACDLHGDTVQQVVSDLRACLESGSLQRELDVLPPGSAAVSRLLLSYSRVGDDVVVVATRVTGREDRAREERERVRELEQLAAMTQSLSEQDEAQQVREALCASARSLAGADVVCLLEPADGELLASAWAQASGQSRRGLLRHAADASWLGGEVFQAGRRGWVPDVGADRRDPLEEAGIGSAFVEPLRVGERVLGVLVVGWHQARTTPPPRAARVMPVLVSQAGAVLVRTGLVARLTDLAGTDALTGLPNRRAWDEEVARTLALARRHSTPACLVVLDVNGLKQVNDDRGHQAGDELLRSAAALWSAQLRAEDFLARLGGDEFGVLVPGLRMADAKRIVARLAGAAPPHLSAAAGVAEWDGRESARELLHRADAAMYVDKRRR